ncbi:hypothetical protein FHS43_004827 [Streptosporangium becharense]|uniref:Uncharacterized protein n=1 Tax=Streptosporangium becharense TaxID=1816182 RepID=A0A7W9IJD8_9ACTN|nr:hypothetical protein [Streptosporangium becharense]MBB2913523.1 hypothetical protein [Streptosporangium becharense]MBB5821213.1 hypothetical protein [Streptosporangium becharense]
MKRLGPGSTLAIGAAMVAVLGTLSVTTSPIIQNVNAEEDRKDREPARSPAARATSQATPAPKASEPAGPTPARADYAGRVKGDSGLIAVSVRNGKAVGYFCDGRIEAWLKGKAAGGEVTLSGRGNASLVARLTEGTGGAGGRATGSLRLGEKEWDFTASTVKKPSGLYRATAVVRGAQVRAGWIYLDDGTRVGLTLVDGGVADVAIPEPGENAVVDGVRIDPKDVDEFIGGL